MFCQKCGKEIHEGAQFCEACGNRVNNTPDRSNVGDSDTASPYFMAAGKSLFQTKNGDLLESSERGFILAAGILYMVFGIFSYILSMSSVKETIESLPREVRELMNASILVGTVIGIGINLFLGIMTISYKRWALLVLRVLLILGIISSAFSLLASLSGEYQQAAGMAGAAMSGVLAFFQLIINIVQLCFVNIGIKALSYDVQNWRTSPKKTRSLAERDTREQ